MDLDPTTFAGSAPHHLRGRPPYSADLVAVVRRELATDGTGRFWDWPGDTDIVIGRKER